MARACRENTKKGQGSLGLKIWSVVFFQENQEGLQRKRSGDWMNQRTSVWR